MPAGVSNGNGVKEPRRTQAVELIARGQSIRQIQAALNISPSTIIALKSAEFERVESRKSILCAQAAQIATAAADQLQDALEQRKLAVGSLPTVFGIAVDKVAVLSPDPTAGLQQHLHLHLSQNNVTDNFNSLLQRLEDKARLLPPITHPDCPEVIVDASDPCVDASAANENPQPRTREKETLVRPKKRATKTKRTK
jgi:hypothetical protein